MNNNVKFRSITTKKYLPIGSVILSGSISRPLIIIGYRALSNDKLYDYVCTAYPEGLVDKKLLVPINHNSIYSVLNTGYIDAYFKSFNIKLIKAGDFND